MNTTVQRLGKATVGSSRSGTAPEAAAQAESLAGSGAQGVGLCTNFQAPNRPRLAER